MELEHTKDWELEHEQGGLKLYSFFCKIDYGKRWAILDDNKNVVLDFDTEDYGSPINFFCGAVTVLTNLKTLEESK